MSRPDHRPAGPRPARLALLVLAAVLVALAVPELVYRAWLGWTERPSFRISPTAHSKFDPRVGQRFEPNTKLSLAYVVDGRLVGCLDEIASANGDGLGGRHARADFARAGLKLFTTGDSYSHWKQNGTTIPDVVADVVERERGGPVANLNFARGAFGLVHMVNIAAVEGLPLKPDLVIIQFILDDLTRGWWYTREHVAPSGERRALLAPTVEALADPRRANDEYIVDARATHDWCRRQLAQGGRDAVLDAAFARYAELRREKRSFFEPLLYEKLISRITQRHLFSTPSLPRLYTVQALRSDPRYVAAVRALRESGVPILLVNLPVAWRQPSRDQAAILAAIEADLGVTTTYLDDRVTSDPAFKWDLRPLEIHPSYEAIVEYGQAVAQVVLQRLDTAASRRP